MELTKIQELLPDPAKLISAIKLSRPEINTASVNQYDIATHDVMIDASDKRPKKKILKTLLDSTGQPVLDEAGNPVIITTYKDVTRIPLAIQRYIVAMRKNFLLGNPVERDASPESDAEKGMMETMAKVWEDNKLDYKLRDVLTYMMSETEVAVICYTEAADKDHWAGTFNEGKTSRIRLQILRSNGGESLYPSYDQYGDMIAFSRAYTLPDEEGKEVEHFDVYTAETNYFFQKVGGSYVQQTTTNNLDKKIPVVYFSQPDVEWADVQRLIDRLETSSSNHGDTNDYFGSPMAVFKGKVSGLPGKDETGKAIELEGDGAMAEYLTWDQSPESVKLEQELLKENIELFTGTPFITMDRMSSLGTFSGVALKMLFALAHMKASEKEAEFGPGVQRLINLFKSMLCQINNALKPAANMSIKPKFTYFLPKNDGEELDNLGKAIDKGIISIETATVKNPLVEDGQAEFEKVKEEKGQAAPLKVDARGNLNGAGVMGGGNPAMA